MNLLNSRTLSRRAILRGAGVSMALPFLEAMVPFGARAQSSLKGNRRMVTLCQGLGMHGPHLFPQQTGRDFESTPYLDTIKEFRDRYTIFSGTSHPEVDGGHSAEKSFLTAAPHPGGSSFKNTISLDQYAVEQLLPDTRFPYLCISAGSYGLSWTRSGVRIPADSRSSRIFAKLFINGTPDEVKQQVRRLKDGQSIMDTVHAQAKKLEGNVAGADREKLDQYFTSVRELEQRLVKAEDWAHKPKPKVNFKQPLDVTDRANFVSKQKNHYDLVHLALKTDTTRIVTLHLGGNNLVPPVQGVSMDWHNLSHHGKDPSKIDQLKLIEMEEMRLFAEFLGKLRDTKEDSSNLLDRTSVLLGSNLGNASNHNTKNLPILLAGGGFKHGQHLAFDEKHNEPLANLFVSMLQNLGVDTARFASGTKPIKGLTA
jgi:hypothetical protein